MVLSVNVFDTGHYSDDANSALVWSQMVALEANNGAIFRRKYNAYNKHMGHTQVIPSDRPRFIKTDLCYRKHDLPHAHNPATDHFVPSFTGFPLPHRGLDANDMSGAPRPHAGGAIFPGASAINPRKPRDTAHGKYSSVDVHGEGKKLPPLRHEPDVHNHEMAATYGPSLFPKRYTKKMAVMQWRGYVSPSGKNNINRNLESTTHSCYRDQSFLSTQRLKRLQQCETLAAAGRRTL